MSSQAVPILMYHAVAHAPAPATRDLSVAPDTFAEQMEVLAAGGFTPVTTARLAAAWREGGPLPARPVLITFDDGYEGVHGHALPELARHGFTATVFVTTGWLRGPYDTGGALDTMLDWQQVKALAHAGIEIGGHSHTHPQLDQLGEDALWFELRRSREIITDETGTAPASFAYPYGYSDAGVRRLVRDAGYGQALAVGNHLARRSQGPYAIRRLTVDRTTGIEEFARSVAGHGVARTFAKDRALTKGYALVRRTRKLRRKAGLTRV
ncbi:polysaccharide deacetylase family protein [Streptomyces indicus]|uniref:Polysaccharide deacetylase n=1 Tax=Streptomyces indicus TaxID=417292 RepID=A0A1G8XUX5_9ACTN|nr:polysaccharide deacetylase family protein [Streptomyces indicus]SDJ94311.1 Polysaccharide deacetylase [Streptomyces indicus]